MVRCFSLRDAKHGLLMPPPPPAPRSCRALSYPRLASVSSAVYPLPQRRQPSSRLSQLSLLFVSALPLPLSSSHPSLSALYHVLQPCLHLSAALFAFHLKFSILHFSLASSRFYSPFTLSPCLHLSSALHALHLKFSVLRFSLASTHLFSPSSLSSLSFASASPLLGSSRPPSLSSLHPLPRPRPRLSSSLFAFHSELPVSLASPSPMSLPQPYTPSNSQLSL